MYTLRIPVNTHTGLPLTSSPAFRDSASPTFRDLRDYIQRRLIAESIISRWDRAVQLSGTCIIIRTPSKLPEHLVEWCVTATREIYSPMSVGTPVQEETSDLSAAMAVAAGVASATGAPRAQAAVSV